MFKRAMSNAAAACGHLFFLLGRTNHFGGAVCNEQFRQY